MRSAWNVEREPTCRKLLAAKFPHAAQYDDVQTVGAHNLAPVDLICGGFPCQDLSVAGQRAGLSGSRSGLYYHLTRITDELKPAFLLWENVPGLHSSDDGRDFARVLVELARIGYSGAWRTFDAQYLGLAQRRRRVFGLFARGDTGAERAAEILSLAEGVRWYPAPRREAGEKPAGTLTRGALDGSSPCGGAGRDTYNDGTDQTYITPTLAGGSRKMSGYSCDDIPVIADCLQERDSKGSGSSTKNGHLIPVAFDSTQITSKTNRSQPQPGDPCHTLAKGAHAPAIAFSPKDHGADAGELAPTLRAMGHRDSHMNGGGQIAIAQTITAEMYRSGGATAGNNQGVRRLTPRECERLQGFPDDWTAGFADSVRYRMLGNAVAVPCARWIGARITMHNIEHDRTRRTDAR